VEKMMQEHDPESGIKVSKTKPFPVDNSASILSTLNAGTTGQEIGHFGLEVNFSRNGKPQKMKMVMKVKPHGKVTASMLRGLAEICGEPLNEVYPKYEKLTGFSNTHMRELEVYKKNISSIQPEIFGISVDKENEIFIILMEYLGDVELLNSVMKTEKWTGEYIEVALLQMAQWHASNLNLSAGLDMAFWKEDVPGKAYMEQLQALWESFLQNASTTLPELYTPENKAILDRGIEKIPSYWSELEKMPKTLIHNDFNPRNICFKREAGSLQLCLYDWELATFHVPQYDVVEFLSFVLIPENYENRLNYVEIYRKELNRLTGKYSDKEEFLKGYAYAALDFGLHRLGMYVMAHTVSPYPFLPRVLQSYFNTLQQVKHLLP
jgi:hypothetical protein